MQYKLGHTHFFENLTVEFWIFRSFDLPAKNTKKEYDNNSDQIHHNMAGSV